MRKEEKRFFSNLDMKDFVDNKKFWNTLKLFFPIILILDKRLHLLTFNNYFKNSVTSLNIKENLCLQNTSSDLSDPAEIALKKFANDPSIYDIKNTIGERVSKFAFSKITIDDIKAELKSLKTFLGITTKHLKQVTDIILEPLMQIWNTEIIENKKFA